MVTASTMVINLLLSADSVSHLNRVGFSRLTFKNREGLFSHPVVNYTSITYRTVYDTINKKKKHFLLLTRELKIRPHKIPQITVLVGCPFFVPLPALFILNGISFSTHQTELLQSLVLFPLINP